MSKKFGEYDAGFDPNIEFYFKLKTKHTILKIVRARKCANKNIIEYHIIIKVKFEMELGKKYYVYTHFKD